MSLLQSRERATPQQAVAAFIDALGAGDLAVAAGCFTRDACLLTPDATIMRGREQIRPLLAQLIAAKASIEIESSWLMNGEKVALLSQQWRIQRPDSEKGWFAQRTVAGACLLNLEDAWKIAILAPWGWPQPRTVPGPA